MNKFRTSPMVKAIVAGIAIAAVFFGGIACGESKPAAPQSGQDIANNRTNFTPKNDVEGRNYNARQAIADNPATLIWCTAFPTSPNAKAFTVPIVGKLTSGNKRPYPTEQAVIDGDTLGMTYNPELPGPDGMFGSSGEYRYGFDPTGNYHDFYGIETYCTTAPNVIQKEQTTIVVKTAGDLTLIDQQVEAALKACRDKDPDPSHTCPEAARLLGA